MSTVNHLSLSQFNLWSLPGGTFLLDGGAMFGVVPKTLWSRKIPADDKNRIKMGMRSMLIKSASTNNVYLVDTGSGEKFDDKMTSIYGLDYSETNLLSSISQAGFTPADITDIIFTHLHFDHCGGTTKYDEQGKLTEVFPNARYHVNRRHWQTATNPNAREKASFFPENLNPIKESGRLHLVDDNHKFEDGLNTICMNGHTAGQQLPVIESEDTTIVFAADLIPTFAHIPLPWVMGYDMEPLKTLAEKKEFLQHASEKKWFLFMEHDAENEVITIKNENGRFGMKDSFSLNEIS